MGLNVLFFGTPAFAIPVLEAVAAGGHQVLAVVTQPDRPSGRKLVVTPPPVKIFAAQRRMPVLQPEKVRAPEFLKEAHALKPDLAVVAAFGQIFPKELLDLPRLGCWNVHASLLPYYRGATPIERCLMAGDKETGISIMQMGEGLDSGDVLSMESTPIAPNETAGELTERLAVIGAKLLLATMAKIPNVTAVPQNHARATLAPKIKKEECVIDWKKPAARIHNLIRALNPHTGARTALNGEPLKIWRSAPADTRAGAPGEIVVADADTLCVATGKGGLSLLELQLPGKKPLDAAHFLRGCPLSVGAKLG